MILGVLSFVMVLSFADAASAASETYCLTAIDPSPGDRNIRYAAELHKRIEPKILVFAQMRVQPAFQKEYSVSIHGGRRNLSIREAKKCFVSYFIADKSIWFSIPENNTEKQRREVSVSTVTIDIPLPLAKRIYAVWRKMLLKTRGMDDHMYPAPDPTTVQFSSESLSAETYYPAYCKSAGLLIELGEKLIDYCKAPAAERTAAEHALEMRASTVERFLRDHP
jgi:hypothetical protein